MRDVSDELMGIEDAIERVEHAVIQVEQAVKNNSPVSLASSVFWFLIVMFMVTVLPGKAWHSKWRYAVQYGISSDKVQHQSEPHDCDFLAAPIGEKYCHYDVSVSTLQWATSTTNHPIVSYDEGKN